MTQVHAVWPRHAMTRASALCLAVALACAGHAAHAQRTYTVTTLEGAFDKAVQLDPANRAQGNRSRYSLKGPEGQLSPTGGYVARSASWAASTATAQQPVSAFALASQWATLKASDNGQWLALKDTNNRTFGRSQSGRAKALASGQGFSPNYRVWAINNIGDMVGHTGAVNSAYQGAYEALWWQNGVSQVLPVAPGVGGWALDINNLGHIGGALQILSGTSPNDTQAPLVARAAVWKAGALSWVADPAVFGAPSRVLHINDAGTLVVEGQQDGWTTLFQVSPAGQVQALTQRQTSPYPHDMNAAGVVVGQAGNRAVMWVQGQQIDLAQHLAAKGVTAVATWRLMSVLDINDQGSMVVLYALPGDAFGVERKARFTAVP